MVIVSKASWIAFLSHETTHVRRRNTAKEEELVFVEERKPEDIEKTIEAREKTNHQTCTGQ
jgi:hypothetical protein